MSGGYKIVPVRDRWGTHHEAQLTFDAEECEGIASYFPSHDRGADELMQAAEECRRADEPDPDAPRLAIGIRLVYAYADEDSRTPARSRPPADTDTGRGR